MNYPAKAKAQININQNQITSRKSSSVSFLYKPKGCFAVLFIAVLFAVQDLGAQIFSEENGLVVMEIESAPLEGKWVSKTEIPGYSGTAYYLATADYLGVGGTDILNYKFLIKTAGVYQIQIRSRIAEGTSSTDHNDNWVRLIDVNSKPVTPVANDNYVTATWYKFYQNKLNFWTWQTSNKDNDPRSLSWNLPAGKYWVQISMRSKGHAVDKIVLWNKTKHALANAATGSSVTANNTALDALSLSLTAPDSIPYPTGTDTPAKDPLSRRFDRSKDILIAQFDNKPDADDIQSQAALVSILTHPDGVGINCFAVAGAYGTQTGKYINSNSLFAMAFGDENTKWTDANTDRANSVNRIVAKVKPVLDAGGWAWVQEAGQSDVTADWVAALLSTGVPAATVKNNVIVVQHSRWNEETTTTADLTFVKSKTNYVEIDDGNVGFGVYSADRPKRQVQTPGFVTADTKFMTEVLSANNPNKKVREYWVEADRIIKASGFNASYSEIPKGGVDFSDCVENWYILGLGDNANSVRKFWDRYVVNIPGVTSVFNPSETSYKNFEIKTASQGNFEIVNPFFTPFTVQIVNVNGKVLKHETGINQSFYQLKYTSQSSGIVIFRITNGVQSFSQKMIIH